MCGRYALAMRPSQIRQLFYQDNMPVDDAPADEGEGAPRQSYNFAPGYNGVVYRADVGDHGGVSSRGSRSQRQARQQQQEQSQQQEEEQGEETQVDEEGRGDDGATTDKDDGEPVEGDQDMREESVEHDDGAGNDKKTRGDGAVRAEGGGSKARTRARYRLQSMKWGLIPFWTKRNPDYAAVLKTINARDDSLAQNGGMWNTMKKGKRCIVVVEGFYEWLKKGPKEKVPHYVKRKDGKLMLLAGLWDCVEYENSEDRLYTYTIITTSSNEQLRFLHDRMPVILDPGSEEIKTWLDPERNEWTSELQSLLKPYKGELEVYPVSKEVGKVGNNSPTFVIPVASKENKSNIANFFQSKGGGGGGEGGGGGGTGKVKPEVTVKKEDGEEEKQTLEEMQKGVDDGGMGTPSSKQGVKREVGSPDLEDVPPAKKKMVKEESASPVKTRPKISATKNQTRSPAKSKAKAADHGSQKITKFFGNSA